MVQKRYILLIILALIGFSCHAQLMVKSSPTMLMHIDNDRYQDRSFGGLTNYKETGRYDLGKYGRSFLQKSSQVEESIMRVTKKYSEDLGIFCKLDNQFDNKMRMPLRFRLGTLDYVNKYEGKNPYVIFPYNN